MKLFVRGLFFVSILCAAAHAADHDGWTPLPVPDARGWEAGAEGRFTGHDGFAWFRAYVQIPDNWAGSRLLLIAGEIDNVDEGLQSEVSLI